MHPSKLMCGCIVSLLHLWIQGDRGEAGERGMDGLQGEEGLRGRMGEKGEQGPVGVDGAMGIMVQWIIDQEASEPLFFQPLLEN